VNVKVLIIGEGLVPIF